MTRAGAVLAATALLFACLGHAHPLGNNTVNRAAAIDVSREQVSIRYLLDLAEIPTLLAAQEADADADGDATPAEWQAYADRRGDEIRKGIELSVDGQPLVLALDTIRWQHLPGAAGLDTLLVEVQFSTQVASRAMTRIDYRDHRRPDETGWKEVIATAGAGVHLADTDVPRASPSQGLTAYPPAETGVPDVRAARIEIRAAAPASPTATAINRAVPPVRTSTPKPLVPRCAPARQAQPAASWPKTFQPKPAAASGSVTHRRQ
jgi:nickel/cobalt transporter (NicO) family protein